jgi:hypothetical protein
MTGRINSGDFNFLFKKVKQGLRVRKNAVLWEKSRKKAFSAEKFTGNFFILETLN